MDRLFVDESAPEPKIVCTSKLDDSDDSRSFSPLEFLAELSAHIPNSWEQTTRFYGVYAARSRTLLDKASQVIRSSVDAPRESSEEPPKPSPELTESTTSKPASKYWAQWIKKVYEVDPYPHTNGVRKSSPSLQRSPKTTKNHDFRSVGQAAFMLACAFLGGYIFSYRLFLHSNYP